MATASPVDVFVYPVSLKSKYVPLTFKGIEGRYTYRLGSKGSIDKALKNLQNNRITILHVQWEEFLFSGCKSGSDAGIALATFEQKLKMFIESGGCVVLTIHNGLPHKIEYHTEFLAAREAVAAVAALVIVHNHESARYLSDQTDVDPGKLRMFLHPSYLGSYEKEQTHISDEEGLFRRDILFFGTIRKQKGVARALQVLSREFLAGQDARVRVSGDGSYVPTLRENEAQRDDVDWDIRYVPDDEAMRLIRTSACVVLSYERFLTSGVAHLVISAGGLYVAPAVSQHLDLLPAVNHRFLYDPHDASDLQRAVAEVLGLTLRERLLAMNANYEVARALRPEQCGLRLAEIYDEALTLSGARV